MRDHADTAANRRPWITLAAAVFGLAALAAVAAGVYGLWFAPKPAAPPTGGAAPAASQRPTEPAPAAAGGGRTGDPERFARWAAETLFAWDAAAMEPSDVAEALIAVGDPTGEETAGLAADIAGYLPDQRTWAKLRGLGARQRLAIDTAEVPDRWEDAAAQARDGQILPGTVAYTVAGARLRDGVWEGRPAVFEEPVAFTVFVTCAPSFPECRLMRLSKLGEPL
ncbi:MAG: hypothetical protein LBK95_05890 [Bifidobacteriaceae bacterium]|jgi:hypothetical protein|nr:hypothetical protein [Bifidobacteriaceae bacterium]